MKTILDVISTKDHLSSPRTSVQSTCCQALPHGRNNNNKRKRSSRLIDRVMGSGVPKLGDKENRQNRENQGTGPADALKQSFLGKPLRLLRKFIGTKR
ncbi:unnamed protein product [Lota lota]